MLASMYFTGDVSMSGCCSKLSLSILLERIHYVLCVNEIFETTDCRPLGALPVNRKQCPLQYPFLLFHNVLCFMKTG